MGTKRRRRHAPDQIICELAEGQRLLAGGQGLDEACRHLEPVRAATGLGDVVDRVSAQSSVSA